MKDLKISQSITNRSDNVSRYMADVNKSSLLTPDEEAELAKKAQKGDQAARAKLIVGNTRFVISVAKQYQNYGLPLDDLISAGNEGLIKAVDKFDESRGFKFISYGVWWIRQSIFQYLYQNSKIVKLPQNIEQGRIKARNYAEKEFVSTGEKLSLHEASEELQLRGAKYITEDYGWGESLSDPRDLNEGLSYEEIIPDDSFTSPDRIDNDNSVLLAAFIRKTLGERDSTIVLMAYGIGYNEPMSNYDIGKNVGLSCERVRQIIKSSLGKLKRRAKITHISLI